VSERERDLVCVFVCERDTEAARFSRASRDHQDDGPERECVCVCERERVCVSQREVSECESERVCVCERERRE
jgi:hypothetical protein